MHIGVLASKIEANTECHHILLEDWQNMELAEGTILVSIPTLLDADSAARGRIPHYPYLLLHLLGFLIARSELTTTKYEQKKEQTAAKIIQRLEKIFPALDATLDYLEVGIPLTHDRFLGCIDGSYRPIPNGKLRGLLGMPFNPTAIPNLYCVGDSTFPVQGLNAVAFSGFAWAHRIAVDLGL